ncbi:thiamine phosphate synthase [uncultured Bacteroides sp.]|uniref:thiamine phosphate synthase n=1 Tax=uncultured Bacteroides sp. TaxID=162156 RepID=UPI002AAA785C|nr:thiamine phosphate synthase [uncultured Bacteroides sp.]
MPIFDLSLYLVTDRRLSLGRSLEEVVVEGVKGGVTMVQLREKECSTLAFYELAMRLKELLSPYKVPLIINDRLDIALACDADGVHIGQSDMPYAVARRMLGYDKIIGLSVETLEQAKLANELDVDYIGISPVFSTPTKTDTLLPFGLDGIQQVKQICKHQAVAIGGIHAENAKQVYQAGADGIAVVSEIMSATDPCKAARILKETLKR